MRTALLANPSGQSLRMRADPDAPNMEDLLVDGAQQTIPQQTHGDGTLSWIMPTDIICWMMPTGAPAFVVIRYGR